MCNYKLPKCVRTEKELYAMDGGQKLKRKSNTSTDSFPFVTEQHVTGSQKMPTISPVRTLLSSAASGSSCRHSKTRVSGTAYKAKARFRPHYYLHQEGREARHSS